LKELGGGEYKHFPSHIIRSVQTAAIFSAFASETELSLCLKQMTSACLIKDFHFLYTHKSSTRGYDALSASEQILEKIHISFQLSATNMKRMITPLLITLGSPPSLSA